jgi:YVTN family beta-propeller protein
MPYGVAVAPDGKRAYVSVSQLDQVAVLALPGGEIVRRIEVGRRPRALALSADGTKLAVANLAGGTISVVNTDSQKEEAQVPLKGVNVRGLAITADGTEAYATCMPAFNTKPADDPREIWHNFVQAVTLDGADSTQAEDQWMDFARAPREVDVIGSPDQHDLVLDSHARYAWIAVTGRDLVSRITVHDRNRNTIWPFSQQETPVGAAPKGLALSPDEKQVWVANSLGNSLSVLDAASGSVVKTIDLGKASRVDPTIAGQYLFQNSGFTRYRRFTCASCHPDGGTDGLTWRFVHVKDGVDRRNTRDLRAGLGDTAPYRWSGLDAHLEGFLKDEVPGLLGGPAPAEEQARALAAAISAFRLPPNPYRRPDGSHTPEGERGRALFDGKAGCVRCHAGPKSGGTGIKAWVGTTPQSLPLDVPHLAGVYDSAPYLHDGRAMTLEEIFDRFNPQGLHGSVDRLSPDERKELLRYVREL